MPLQRASRIAARLSTAARVYGASPVALGGRMLWLRALTGVRLDEAAAMGLLDPGLPAPEAARFVGEDAFTRLLRRFNPPPTDLVDDKILLHACCRAHGLPTPRVLAVVTPPVGVTEDGRPLRSAADWRAFLADLPGAFVLKPARGSQGDGVEVLERRGEAFACGDRRWSADDLHRRLCVEARCGRAVIQERLANHPVLSELAGVAGLQCTRIATVVDRAGEVAIFDACQKLIVGRNATDNFRGGVSGNLVACVDVATGVLGHAFAPGPSGIGVRPCDTHPDTGRTIPGTALPMWREACELAARAALRVLPLRSIGWDVALTPDGPAIVEGNTAWFSLTRRGFWRDAGDLERLRAAF